MPFFDRFNDKKHSHKTNTSNFHIGSPEAEAESVFSSKIKLAEVFEDFLGVLPQLSSEKFIITGRKGSGKTAIAEKILFEATNDPQTFCDFVKKDDIDIEQITQIVSKEDKSITESLLMDWIILTKFTKQLIQDKSLVGVKKIKDLEVFLDKNSGFIDITMNQITEIQTKKSILVKAENFSRFIKAQLGKDINYKGKKPPFYTLIPHLKDTIENLFFQPENKQNDYLLIFDDLDIRFNFQNQSNVNSILSLLRSVRRYNIDFFGKKGINAKIIVLLRDDISRILVNKDADTAKLFSSYEIPLKWYEHAKLYRNENELKLKNFINKRIGLNFKLNDFYYDENDPWNSLINENVQGNTSFQYVVKHTLQRPRDLILFFKPLSQLKYKIPLGKPQLTELFRKFSSEFVNELKNELTAHYLPNEIDTIFKVLNNCVRSNDSGVSYNYFVTQINNNDFSGNSDKLLDLLFDLSIIGNEDLTNNKTYFKHWEDGSNFYKQDKDCKIIFHFTLKIYFKNY